MPRPQDPLDPTEPDLDVASAIMGNRTKALVVRYLWLNGSTTASELVRELGILQGTISASMQQLEQWAVVSTDVPADRRHGRSVTYTLDRERLQQLIDLWRAFVTDGDWGS
ncbi:ArsR family transcriptional regulator (plasmid) [Curtobacterium sp. TC1]|uniref:ArsR/SmtB family transcription factor n=1 Tax=Curtobacterium sp. TC1 TaxID=2862880 RepID=UPI001C9AC09E|nr:helix-turn-helix transcriptional regulator [Curtobacterium sp. TC1]QZQ53763.1 ArsR family transcriptional regulator [Curtobacterium sp. TC1]